MINADKFIDRLSRLSDSEAIMARQSRTSITVDGYVTYARALERAKEIVVTQAHGCTYTNVLFAHDTSMNNPANNPDSGGLPSSIYRDVAELACDASLAIKAYGSLLSKEYNVLIAPFASIVLELEQEKVKQ